MNVYVYCVDIIYILQETGGGGMGKGSHERENTLRPPTFDIMVAPLYSVSNKFSNINSSIFINNGHCQNALRAAYR